MLGSISNRTLLEPRSLNDALKMLRDEGPLVPLAGCTDLYVALNFGTLKDTRFVNLWRLLRCGRSHARGDALSIGALTTHSDLIRSALVRARLPMLAAAAREIGSVQIQNRGTIGGNVANASPAATRSRYWRWPRRSSSCGARPKRGAYRSMRSTPGTARPSAVRMS